MHGWILTKLGRNHPQGLGIQRCSYGTCGHHGSQGEGPKGHNFANFKLLLQIQLTLSRPISLHSRKPPGPHCFEPFTCNVYRSFQPHNMHMCKQFWGKVSTAKIFYDYQTYLWFVWYFLQNEHELKIEEIFLPWKAKHTGKIVAP